MYDINAIEILDKHSRSIGWVPINYNKEIAKEIDKGRKFYLGISQKHGGGKYNYGLEIVMTTDKKVIESLIPIDRTGRSSLLTNRHINPTNNLQQNDLVTSSNNKKEKITAIKERGIHPDTYMKLPLDLRKDKDIGLAVVKNSKTPMLAYLDKSLKNDRDIVKAAVSRHGMSIQFVNEKMKADKDIVLAAVQSNGESIRFVSNVLKRDKEIVMAAVQSRSRSIRLVNDELKKDKEIVLFAIQDDGNNFQYVSNELKKDKEVVLAAIESTSNAIEYIDDSLWRDKEVVLVAIGSTSNAIDYMDKRLWNDREIILEILKNLDSASLTSEIKTMLFSINENLRNDSTIISMLNTLTFEGLSIASERLRNDKEFVRSIIKNSYGWKLILKYVGDDIKKDKEIVSEAIYKNWKEIDYVDETIKTDRDVMLSVVSGNGLYLKHLPDNLKRDKEIVLNAVKNRSGALEYANEIMKKDIDIAKEIYRRLGSTGLAYLSKELLSNKQSVLDIISTNPSDSYKLYPYLGSNLKTDKEIAVLILKSESSLLEHMDISIKKNIDVIKEVIKYSSDNIFFEFIDKVHIIV